MEFLHALFLMPIELLMHVILDAAYTLTNSYGIAIIFLSLAINFLLIPVYNIAERWRAEDKSVLDAMKKTIEDIKENYKGKERYFYIQATYRVNNYSPFSSVKATAGLLIQIPFFFAAFKFLSSYDALSGVSFGPLTDLSNSDAFLRGINLMPFVMTIVSLTASYFYFQDSSKSEKYQAWGLATLFLILLYNQASGLLLYWTVNNIFSLARSFMRNSFNLNTDAIRNLISKINLKKKQQRLLPKYIFKSYFIQIAVDLIFIFSKGHLKYTLF